MSKLYHSAKVIKVILLCVTMIMGCTQMKLSSQRDIRSVSEYRNSHENKSISYDMKYDGTSRVIIAAKIETSGNYEQREKKIKEYCYEKEMMFGPIMGLLTLPFGILQLIFDRSQPGCREGTDYTSWETRYNPATSSPYTGKIRFFNDGYERCLSPDASEKYADSNGMAAFYIRHTLQCVPFNSNADNSTVKNARFKVATDYGSDTMTIKYKQIAEKQPEPPPQPVAKKMKVCPKCKKKYDSKYSFCIVDGAKLR